MYRCTHCGAFNRVPSEGRAGTPVCGRCKQTLDLSGAPQAVDAEGYARARASSPVPVVVDFWAAWCGPCRAAEPIIEAYARKHAGQVLVLKVDADQAQAAMSSLGIRSIPTFVALKDNLEVARQSGVLPADAFERWTAQAFSQATA